MPVVTYLRDESLTQDHWAEIKEIVSGIPEDLNSEDFTLNSLIELNVKKDKDKIGDIALKANKERELSS